MTSFVQRLLSLFFPPLATAALGPSLTHTPYNTEQNGLGCVRHKGGGAPKVTQPKLPEIPKPDPLPPTPPPPTETASVAEQSAQEAQRNELRKKGMASTLLAGESAPQAKRSLLG